METVIPLIKDQAWFEDTYRTHQPRVRAFVLRRAPHAVDDVVNETFATLWARRDVVPVECLPWLLTTARHHVLHNHRTTQRRRGLFNKLTAVFVPSTPDHADVVAHDLDLAPVVQSLFESLNDADVEILQLWAWDGLSGPEIAQVLQISPTAARSRLMRARSRARAVLGDVVSSDEGDV